MKVKSESEVAQSCPTLSDLMDFSLPGSSIHGIFQARMLEWDAIAFSQLGTQEMSNESYMRSKCLINDKCFTAKIYLEKIAFSIPEKSQFNYI